MFKGRIKLLKCAGLVAGVALAGARPSHAQEKPVNQYQRSVAEEKLAQLKAHAEKMHEQDRGRIYSDIARELTEIANEQYNDSRPEAARATIKEAVSYAEKATDSAKIHGKKIKDTEISLRECARRLEEIRRSVLAEEQPPLKDAILRIDQLRKQLLDHMFKKD
jgi:hypothetical protein